MRTARIIGTGKYIPKRCVTNEELLKIIGNFDLERAKKALGGGPELEKLSKGQIFDLWVNQVCGIRKRFFWDNDFDNGFGASENMGAEAAKKALESTGISPEKIDYIIAATFTQNYNIPNPALAIAELIRAREIGTLHINTACSGFLDGIIDATCRIKSGNYKTILVVATEHLRKVVDNEDAATSVLFSDGASAAVLTSYYSRCKGSIAGSYTGGEFSRNIHQAYDKKIIMERGNQVLKKAVESMNKAAEMAMGEAGWTIEDVDILIPHQANRRITDGLIRRLRIPEEKVVSTIKNYGNTSGASIGIALDMLVRGELEQKIQRGHRLLMTAVGGGYTMASIAVEY